MEELSVLFELEHYYDRSSLDFENPLQLGHHIQIVRQTNFDFSDADIVIIGCGEFGGKDPDYPYKIHSADKVRDVFYQMYNWHPAVKIADLGNLLEGSTLNNTRAALKLILEEVDAQGKLAVIIGGSQDLTLQQFEIFKKHKRSAELAIVDMLIDMEDHEGITDRNFLFKMLVNQPNYIKQYNHIGFQSYYVNPQMLETLDKLRFDFFRLGKAKQALDEIEPVLRNCDILSVDLNAIRYSDMPLKINNSPNGFLGDEMCQIMRAAAMGTHLSSIGLYGYDSDLDTTGIGAQQIAQMMWYILDGFLIRKIESPITHLENFLQYSVVFNEGMSHFIKSKKTNRWWMSLPNGMFIPSSYIDYKYARNGEMPERWIRAQEREY